MRSSVFTFSETFCMSYILLLSLSDFLIMKADGGFLDDIVSTANDVVNTVETATVDAYNTVANTAVDGFNETRDLGQQIGNQVETSWDTAENERENTLANFDNKCKDDKETTVDNKDVKFKYYTQDIIQGTPPFNIEEFDVNKLQGWRQNAPLTIITHGWKSSDVSDSVIFLKDEYLRKVDLNIISVDWSGLAKDDIFIKSAVKVGGVGIIIARLLNDLVQKSLVSWEKVQLIGHGLGGQVMGVTGANADKLVGRIIALDPSSIIFNEMTQPDKRALDATDAQFVVIIHTAGGELKGTDMICGTIDFYPNGGIHPQPGCLDTDRKCSNGRAYEFFAESIKNPEAFTGLQCDNWTVFLSGACASNVAVIMGDQTPNTASGIFYLATNAKPPYGN